MSEGIRKGALERVQRQSYARKPMPSQRTRNNQFGPSPRSTGGIYAPKLQHMVYSRRTK